MNVLVLSELFYPHGGGAELATALYADILAEAGFDVTVLTNKSANERDVTRKRNLTIYRTPLFKGDFFKYNMLWRSDILFRGFFRKLVKWSDIVYIPRLWFTAIPLAKVFRKKVLVHLHDYIPVCPLANSYDLSQNKTCHGFNHRCPSCIYSYEKLQGRQNWQSFSSVFLNSTVGPLMGNMAELSDFLICVSRCQRNIVLDKKPSLAKKTCVIYNPVPQLCYSKMEGDDFGYFGGPNWYKGFGALFAAVSHLTKKYGPALNIHATKFTGLNVKLSALLEKSGFLLYGKLTDDEYARLYQGIRSVIVPSLWHEPWPYVVVEALIKGRFVVASNAGGIPEQLSGCKGTLLFDIGDERKLAENIEVVLNMKREQIAELGTQNRETFLRRRDTEVASKRFTRLLEKLG